MDNKLINASDFSNYHFLGLKQSQWLLYCYVDKCHKTNQSVDIIEVAKIFYNFTKNPDGYFDSRNRPLRLVNDLSNPLNELRNKDVIERYLNNSNSYPYYFPSMVMPPVKNWFRSTIGSLTVKGFFKVTPCFNSELALKELYISKINCNQ